MKSSTHSLVNRLNSELSRLASDVSTVSTQFKKTQGVGEDKAKICLKNYASSLQSSKV